MTYFGVQYAQTSVRLGGWMCLNCGPYGRQAEMSFIERCAVSFVRPHSRTALEKLTVAQLLRTFPVLHLTRKFYHHVHMSPPRNPSWVRSNPLFTLTSCFCKICFNIILPCKPKCIIKFFCFLRPSRLQPYMYFSSHNCATCSVNLITLILFGDEHKVRSSLLRNFLHSLWGPHVVTCLLLNTKP
jgi:hypothetical protein